MDRKFTPDEVIDSYVNRPATDNAVVVTYYSDAALAALAADVAFDPFTDLCESAIDEIARRDALADRSPMQTTPDMEVMAEMTPAERHAYRAQFTHPHISRFSPTVQAVIARSYEGSLQQMADNNQPRPLPRSPFEKVR